MGHTKRKGRGPFFFSLFSFSLNGLWFRLPSAKTCVSCGLRNSLRVEFKMGLSVLENCSLNASIHKRRQIPSYSAPNQPHRVTIKKEEANLKKRRRSRTSSGFLVG